MNRFRSAAGALLVAVMALTLTACGYNTIPTQDIAVQSAWSEVQTQYQRRADLIPQLVATVQGYASQESNVLTAVTQARASATQVKVDASTITDPASFQRFQDAQNQLSGVLGRLMMIQENYPQLKSNENFLALQSQLEGTENRIAVARRDYNNAVTTYNTTLVTFPQVIWAKTVHSGHKPAVMFSATAAAQAAPTVTFTGSAAPAPSPAAAQPKAPAPAPAK